MKLSSNEIALLAAYGAHRDGELSRAVVEVTRRSEREYDLEVTAKEFRNGEFFCSVRCWLPLGSIGWLVDWDKVGPETDFGDLAAGWSAVRDSKPETIWAIFAKHVLEK